jgi:hypothetical protein
VGGLWSWGVSVVVGGLWSVRGGLGRGVQRKLSRELGQGHVGGGGRLWSIGGWRGPPSSRGRGGTDRKERHCGGGSVADDACWRLAGQGGWYGGLDSACRAVRALWVGPGMAALPRGAEVWVALWRELGLQEEWPGPSRRVCARQPQLGIGGGRPRRRRQCCVSCEPASIAGRCAVDVCAPERRRPTGSSGGPRGGGQGTGAQGPALLLVHTAEGPASGGLHNLQPVAFSQ